MSTFARKTLCIFLSITLVIGFSIPQNFAFAEDAVGDIAQTSKTEDNVQDDEEAVSLPAAEAEISNGDDAGETPDPSVDPTDPIVDPEPTPQPDPSPVTFKFNIASSPTIKEIENVTTGIMITWTPISNVDGYIVLRRQQGAGDAVDDIYKKALSGNSITLDPELFKLASLRKVGWASYLSTSTCKQVSWIDTKASYGTAYEYAVMAYRTNASTSNNSAGLPYIPSYVKGRDVSRPSTAKVGYRVKSPTLSSVSKKSKSSTMTVKWGKVAGVTGYTVQCSLNSAFSGKRIKSIKSASTTSTTFTGLSKSRSYCVRIRAYAKVNGTTWYSPWKTSSYTTTTKRASMSRLLYKYKVKKKVTVKTTGKAVKAATTSNLKNSKTKTKTTYVTKSTPFELRVRAGQTMGKYDTMQGGCSDGTYMYLCLLSKTKKRCKIAKVKISTRKVVKVSAPLKLNHGNGLAYNSKTKRIVVAHGEGNRKALTVINKTTLKKVKTVTVSAPATLKGATPSQLSAYKGFGSIAYSADKNVYVGLLYGSHNIVLMDSNFKMIEYISLSKKQGQIYQAVEVVGDSILIGESFGSTYAKRYNIMSTYNWDGQFVTTTRLQQSFELESVFAAGKRIYAGFYRSYVKNRKFMKDNYIYRVTYF